MDEKYELQKRLFEEHQMQLAIKATSSSTSIAEKIPILIELGIAPVCYPYGHSNWNTHYRLKKESYSEEHAPLSASSYEQGMQHLMDSILPNIGKLMYNPF